MTEALVAPDYSGGCISNIVPALLAEGRPGGWLPDIVRGARQVVLLVLDGLGWTQLQARRHLAPTMAGMAGGPITSVAPSTTATALCSILLGMAPADHGIVGYRMRVPGDLVLNILRWRTAEGDARDAFPPADLQPRPAFLGRPTPVVTRAEFTSTGFSTALGITRLHGWHAPSSISVEVGNLLADGEPLVYAYYDSVDRVAHAHGFDSHYDAELVAADGLVAALRDVLPPGAVLVVTADHGQVEVGDRLVLLDERLMADTSLLSGESRFTWLHARPGCVEAVIERSRSLYESTGLAAVLSRRSVIDSGWFGGPLSPAVADRLGDVALVALQPVAFLDPADLRSSGLRCRHGSLTADEMLVPLLAVGST